MRLFVTTIGLALLLTFGLLTSGADAATGDYDGSELAPSISPPGLADKDGNRIADALEAQIDAAAAGDRFAVIVTFAGPGNAASAQAAVGAFALKREFSIIKGFAATMTVGQVRALSQKAGIARIEEDGVAYAFNDEAQAKFGGDMAQPYPRHLPQFLPVGQALAVQRLPAGRRRIVGQEKFIN